MVACNNVNPLLTEWDTPYGIPPYDKIKVSDYLPAIKTAIAENKAEIDSIVNNPDAPTFENTIEALEYSGKTLAKVTGVLFNVSETDGSDELNKVVEEAMPLLSEAADEISMNKGLYERVKAVYEADQSGLTAEQKMVLKKTYEGFTRNGIGLDEAGQAELKEINSRLSTLSTKFGKNLLEENKAFEKEFGFPAAFYYSKMASIEDRGLREKIFKAYSSRGHKGNANDNRAICAEILALKTRKAQLLGFENSASYILDNKMAHDPQTVDTFLKEIMDAAMAKARKEIVEMEKISGFKIQPWDWSYYAEKVRKAQYDLDEDVIRQYFSMENVRKGMFLAAKKLYGINAEPLKDVPVYNPAVETFKITDENGEFLGIFTTDYFPRSSKRGGAWMNNVREEYVDRDGKEIRPIIVNVGNLAAPTDTTPSLMSIDDVQTMFHEFGHALHGLLTKCHYVSVSGTAVSRDFVEVFSQFNENFAFQPELLAEYAFHYKTGEVIPDSLVQKINNSLKFNQGFMTGELAAASILDMKLHELALAKPEDLDIDAFEAQACKEMGLIDEIIPRYRPTYFSHIFDGGYSAGYYGYLWAEVIDQDAFDQFRKNGIFNKELATSFRKTFLEKGGSEEPMALYRSWRGQDPDPAALMRFRGLIEN